MGKQTNVELEAVRNSENIVRCSKSTENTMNRIHEYDRWNKNDKENC